MHPWIFVTTFLVGAGLAVGRAAMNRTTTEVVHAVEHSIKLPQPKPNSIMVHLEGLSPCYVRHIND
jgi:hypothetical protein